MTIDDFKEILRPLRLEGAHVIAHTSLSACGDLEGGAPALCQALMQLVGERGTLLMPAFTYDETLLPTGPLRGPHISYHLDLPVSSEIGRVAETFRRLPGVVRSSHPTHSFAAWGRQAREVLSTQRDNNLLGPLKKLNLIQGDVLLLGTSLHSATVIHLAEERMAVSYLERRTAVRINTNGHEERVVLEKVPGCSAAFDRIEVDLDPTKVATVPLPGGTARRIPVRHLLSIASRALDNRPDVFVCERSECDSCARKRALMAS